MTVSESRSANSAENLLLKALAISLALHLVAFGGWKWGQTHGWWTRSALPAWLQRLENNVTSAIAKKIVVPLTKQAPPILYVDVDPALAVPKPPEKPKYYSSENTLAANPEKKKASDAPEISGRQKEVMKTVPSSPKSFPLQPSPPKPDKTEVAETKPLPKPELNPGEITIGKPAEKKQETKGTSDTKEGTAEKAETKEDRPRTLAEARERQGIIGTTTQQNGGVNRIAMESSLDAMRTVYGDYDRDFIEAVQARWFELLKDRAANNPGKVILDFNLHPNGYVTDMKTTFTDVDELQTIICKQAILDPAPYKPWPEKMRQEIPDPREVQFTFFYINE